MKGDKLELLERKGRKRQYWPKKLHKIVLTDPVHVSNELNSHFASVGPILASAMPQSKKDFCKYLPSSVPFSSFFLNWSSYTWWNTTRNLVIANK